MRSLLSEAEKKKILEDVTRKVTPEVTLKVDVKCVRALMKNLNMGADEAIAFLEIPAERQAAVLKKILEQKQNE